MLMNRLSARERFQKMLPKDDILCAELGDVGLLGVHQLQKTSFEENCRQIKSLRKTNLRDLLVRVLRELERPLLPGREESRQV